MAIPIQGQNRGELRRLIGPALGIMTSLAATTTVDTSSLIDTLNLRGADDEHNGKELVAFDPAGSIVAGEKSRVSDFDGDTYDATCAPVFSATITTGDDFELWNTPWLSSDINKAIDEAILRATSKCLQNKVTETTFTKPSTYLYDCLSGFKGVEKVEHEYGIGTEVIIDDCDTVWTAGTSVTASLDTTLTIEGSSSVKLVVAAGAAAGAVLGYGTISSSDLTKCDKIEISMYSTIALTAGYLDLVLDDHAGCVSPTESLDIPAMAANTWYRHIITLANPVSDTAIISVGLVNTTDVGACTLYIDYIRAVDSRSRNYKELNDEYWDIAHDSTPLLQLTTEALSVIGTPKLLKITGYQLPALLSDDTTDVEIDPDYIVNMAKGLLMSGHSKARTLDVENREKKGNDYITLALNRLNQIGTQMNSNIRWV